MEQLLLDFDQLKPIKPSLANFVIGDNAELIAYLQQGSRLSEADYDVCYVFGVSGSGKTHLLKAMTEDKGGLYLDAGVTPDLGALAHEAERQLSCIAIDHMDKLDDTGQQRLFHLCNLAKHNGLALLISADVPPGQLSIRKDLQLRLSQGVVYQLLSLSDEQKLSALRNYVNARAMVITDEVLSYLLNRTSRDLSHLIGLLDFIDQVSLSLQQKPTLPMVRHLLASLQKRESC